MEKEIDLTNIGQFAWFFGTGDFIFSNSKEQWIPLDGRAILKEKHLDFLYFIEKAGLENMGFDISDSLEIFVPDLRGNYFVGASMVDSDIGQRFEQSLPAHTHQVNDHDHVLPDGEIQIYNGSNKAFRVATGVFSITGDNGQGIAGEGNSDITPPARTSVKFNGSTNVKTGLTTQNDGGINEGEVKPKHIRLMPCIRAK